MDVVVVERGHDFDFIKVFDDYYLLAPEIDFTHYSRDMRISLDICAGGVGSAVARARLRLVLSRFAPSVVRVMLRAIVCGPGRVRLHGEAHLAAGGAISVTTEDELSDAAMMHFIDRFGRAVARRSASLGGPRA